MTQDRLMAHKLFLFVFIAGLLVGLSMLANFLVNHSFYYRVFDFLPKGESVLPVKVPKISVDPAKLDSDIEARAVPIIFYHGVLEDAAADDTNVTRSNFLSQMVALKREGYYTIDTKDLIDYYAGTKKLYGKPILISFDDGRVDSYRPTDDILRQLGFKAVFFIVSGKQDNKDPFFLSWGQLQKAAQSGRWDMQAHGWFSHQQIKVDAAGEEGNPLTNRKWLPAENRLEDEGEASQRIENDYAQNLKDMKEHFPNHDVTTFAVPFGDNGLKENNFINHGDALALNYNICKKYFKMCFLIDGQGWNFAEHDPLQSYRMEVLPGWNGELLLRQLANNHPNTPAYNLDFTSGHKPSVKVKLLGSQQYTPKGLQLTSPAGQGYVDYDLGNQNSFDYKLSSSYTATRATSFYMSMYKYSSSSNTQNVLFGTTADSAYLRITKNGITTELGNKEIPGYKTIGDHTMAVEVKRGHFKGYVDGKLILETELPTLENRGTYGFDIFDPQGAQAIIKNLTVSSTL